MSPRLPSGALLAITVAMTAATAVLAALPAQAAPGAPGGIAASRAGMASQAAADKIRDQEWWLANLHVTQAWAATRGTGVTVAVLSSGVAADHPDLTGSVITGPDFTESGETPATPSWGIEGTSAASIIAGHGDNVGDAAGIIGIAPAARILSVRVVLDATDPLNGNPAAVQRLPAAIAAGIRYAAAHGAQVIDLPLDPASLASDGAATGGLSAAAGGSAAEQAAVDYALGKGAVLIAPTSDNGEDGNEPTYPAAYPGVIAVGTVDRHFVRAAFSSRQSYVALTAPGVDLTTASPPSGYRNMSTTDAASAVVAGVAALIRSRYPTLNNSQVRQALVTGSVPRPPSATGAGYGAGTVDALKAVQAAALIAAAARGTVGLGQLTGGGTPAHDPARSAQNGHPGPGQDGAAGRGHGCVHAHPSAAGELDRHPGPAPAGGPGAPSRPGTLDPAERSSRAAGDTGRCRPAHASGCGGARRRADGGGGNGALADRTRRPGHTAIGRDGETDRSQRRRRPGGRYLGRHLPSPAAHRRACCRYPARRHFRGPFLARTRPASRHGRVWPVLSRQRVPGASRLPMRRPRAMHPQTPRCRAGEPGRRARNRRRGGQSAASPRIGAHGLRVGVTPVSRTVPRAQVTPPGGPPWEPAPMPEGELPHDTVQRVPDPFASFAPPSPTTSAPWDVAASGPPLPRRGQLTSQDGPALPAAGPAPIPGP